MVSLLVAGRPLCYTRPRFDFRARARSGANPTMKRCVTRWASRVASLVERTCSLSLPSTISSARPWTIDQAATANSSGDLAQAEARRALLGDQRRGRAQEGIAESRGGTARSRPTRHRVAPQVRGLTASLNVVSLAINDVKV